jgi:hypothetical protein
MERERFARREAIESPPLQKLRAHSIGYFDEGCYRILTRGQTLTLKGLPCRYNSGSPQAGEGNPCDSIMLDRHDSRRLGAEAKADGRFEPDKGHLREQNRERTVR